MGELYGEYNLMTMEWKDGLMAITIRRCVKVKGEIRKMFYLKKNNFYLKI